MATLCSSCKSNTYVISKDRYQLCHTSFKDNIALTVSAITIPISPCSYNCKSLHSSCTVSLQSIITILTINLSSSKYLHVLHFFLTTITLTTTLPVITCSPIFTTTPSTTLNAPSNTTPSTTFNTTSKHYYQHYLLHYLKHYHEHLFTGEGSRCLYPPVSRV